MPYIEGEDRNQIILFPESIDEYISMDNPVRVIDAYVEQLDMAALGFKFAQRPTVGRPPYHPGDLLKLYIYGYLNRVRSSRRLEHETHRNLEVMWLLKRLTPDFKTIADFRKDHKKALKQVFRDFNRLCDQWDLFGKETVAIDSSKFKASNSKKNNFTQKKLNRKLKHIDKKIDTYLEELDENDQAESGDRKPNAEEIKKRIEQLRARRETYTGYKKELEESGKSEISTTDPDARLMATGNNSVDVGYNVQTTVDAKHKLVLDFKVTTQANDSGRLDNMAVRAKKLCDDKEIDVLADKGYYRAEDLKRCVRRGITPYVSRQTYSNGTGDKDFYADKFIYDKENNCYICPAGSKLKLAKTRRKGGQVLGYDYRNFQACASCQYKARCTKSKQGRSIFRHVDQDFLDAIDLHTEANMDKYKLRQTIVEHPFGTVKGSWGAYFFLTRRTKGVTVEMSLSYLAYNLRRVMSILGTEEIVRRLKERRKPVLV
jgi:transposase